MAQVDLIAAGATKGLVEALSREFAQLHGATIAATFGAVGAMRETFLGGARCDAIALTAPMLDQLATEGQVRGDTICPIGNVRTGVAVRSGDPMASVGSASALRESLRSATSIHVPDLARSTAGMHFAKIVDALGVREELAARLRPYPNGATAMAALARAADARPIGCTQVTEIIDTQGVMLCGVLPEPYGLVTAYAAAVSGRAANARLAEAFVALVCGARAVPLRVAAGFED